MLFDSKGNPLPNEGKFERINGKAKSLLNILKKSWLLLGSILAGLALVVTNYTTIVNAVLGKKSDLESVLYFNNDTRALDFSLTNSGEKTVIIHKIILEVEEIEMGTDVTTARVLPSSATYEIDVSNLTKKGDRVEHKISHALAPNEADRFQVKLRSKSLEKGKYLELTLRVKLDTSDGRIEAGSCSDCKIGFE